MPAFFKDLKALNPMLYRGHHNVKLTCDFGIKFFSLVYDCIVSVITVESAFPAFVSRHTQEVVAAKWSFC